VREQEVRPYLGQEPAKAHAIRRKQANLVPWGGFTEGDDDRPGAMCIITGGGKKTHRGQPPEVVPEPRGF